MGVRALKERERGGFIDSIAQAEAWGFIAEIRMRRPASP